MVLGTTLLLKPSQEIVRTVMLIHAHLLRPTDPGAEGHTMPMLLQQISWQMQILDGGLITQDLQGTMKILIPNSPAVVSAILMP